MSLASYQTDDHSANRSLSRSRKSSATNNDTNLNTIINSNEFIPPYSKQFTQRMTKIQQQRVDERERSKEDNISSRANQSFHVAPSFTESQLHKNKRSFGSVPPAEVNKDRTMMYLTPQDYFASETNVNNNLRSGRERGRSISRINSYDSRSRSRSLSSNNSVGSNSKSKSGSKREFLKQLQVQRDIEAAKKQEEEILNAQKRYFIDLLKGNNTATSTSNDPAAQKPGVVNSSKYVNRRPWVGGNKVSKGNKSIDDLSSAFNIHASNSNSRKYQKINEKSVDLSSNVSRSRARSSSRGRKEEKLNNTIDILNSNNDKLDLLTKKLILNKAWRRSPWPGLIPSNGPNYNDVFNHDFTCDGDGSQPDQAMTNVDDLLATRHDDRSFSVSNEQHRRLSRSASGTIKVRDAIQDPALASSANRSSRLNASKSASERLSMNLQLVDTTNMHSFKHSFGILTVSNKSISREELLAAIEKQFYVVNNKTINDVFITCKQHYSKSVFMSSLSLNTIDDFPLLNEDTTIVVYISNKDSANNQDNNGNNNNLIYSDVQKLFPNNQVVFNSNNDNGQATSNEKKSEEMREKFSPSKGWLSIPAYDSMLVSHNNDDSFLSPIAGYKQDHNQGQDYQSSVNDYYKQQRPGHDANRVRSDSVNHQTSNQQQPVNNNNDDEDFPAALNYSADDFYSDNKHREHYYKMKELELEDPDDYYTCAINPPINANSTVNNDTNQPSDNNNGSPLKAINYIKNYISHISNNYPMSPTIEVNLNHNYIRKLKELSGKTKDKVKDKGDSKAVLMEELQALDAEEQKLIDELNDMMQVLDNKISPKSSSLYRNNLRERSRFNKPAKESDDTLQEDKAMVVDDLVKQDDNAAASVEEKEETMISSEDGSHSNTECTNSDAKHMEEQVAGSREVFVELIKGGKDSKADSDNRSQASTASKSNDRLNKLKNIYNRLTHNKDNKDSDGKQPSTNETQSKTRLKASLSTLSVASLISSSYDKEQYLSPTALRAKQFEENVERMMRRSSSPTLRYNREAVVNTNLSDRMQRAANKHVGRLHKQREHSDVRSRSNHAKGELFGEDPIMRRARSMSRSKSPMQGKQRSRNGSSNSSVEQTNENYFLDNASYHRNTQEPTSDAPQENTEEGLVINDLESEDVGNKAATVSEVSIISFNDFLRNKSMNLNDPSNAHVPKSAIFQKIQADDKDTARTGIALNSHIIVYDSSDDEFNAGRRNAKEKQDLDRNSTNSSEASLFVNLNQANLQQQPDERRELELDKLTISMLQPTISKPESHGKVRVKEVYLDINALLAAAE